MSVPHICVCICTYRRPALLTALLRSLRGQRTDGEFTYSALVVDNDAGQSARAAIEQVAPELGFAVAYHVEPQKNIALARNRAVLNAPGDYVATIDDDETAAADWLILLFRAIQRHACDGALGPVLPAYSTGAPGWLRRSGLCDRPEYPTGTNLTERHHTRTGNTMLHRRIFAEGRNLFDPQFGLTGGEDKEFFDLRIAEGFRFVWCQEAVAYEEVPPERSTFEFYWRKSIRIGALTGEKMRKGTVPLWSNGLKSAVLAIAYLPLLPLLAFGGKAVLARHTVKWIYHVSRVLAVFGIVLIRVR